MLSSNADDLPRANRSQRHTKLREKTQDRRWLVNYHCHSLIGVGGLTRELRPLLFRDSSQGDAISLTIDLVDVMYSYGHTGFDELIWRWYFSYSMMYPWLTGRIIREYIICRTQPESSVHRTKHALQLPREEPLKTISSLLVSTLLHPNSPTRISHSNALPVASSIPRTHLRVPLSKLKNLN